MKQEKIGGSKRRAEGCSKESSEIIVKKNWNKVLVYWRKNRKSTKKQEKELKNMKLN